MARKPYDTDLTDRQWNELKPLIPPEHPGGRPRGQDMREVLNGILYVLRTEYEWRHMHHDLPKPHTCCFYFNHFSTDGTRRNCGQTLHPATRVNGELDRAPEEAIVDAQSVKTTKKRA